MKAILNILGGVTSLYMILIFIRIMLTWFTGASYGKPLELLSRVTDPYLSWFRRFPVLRMASLDLSPIAALGVLSVLNNILLTLSRYGSITLGLILAMVLRAAWSAVSFILGFCIVVLILRLVAYLTNRDVYGSFWRIIDTISQPIIYRTNRIIFRKRLVNYLTGLLSAAGLLFAARIGGGIILRVLINLTARLPF
jgi:YggT family protein